MIEFHLYDVPARRGSVIEAEDFVAAKARVEAEVPAPANRQAEWKLCGSGQLLTVKSAQGTYLGSYLLRSA